MNIKGFKSKDGTVHKYDHNALANIPENGTVTDQQIAAAVEKYLTENPVDGVTDQQIYDAVTEYLTENPVEGVTDEQIAQTVADYLVKNPIDVTGVVKTVNGVEPDETGNVEITIPDSSQNVNPIAKTEDMTQPVGVDENGLLYTAPGTGNDDLKTELSRQIIIEAVRQNNHAKNAIRIATYNIYGAGYNQNNWPRLKEQLYQYGLDICAMQEVKDPLGINDGNAKFAEEMTSTMLPYASTNGELYPTNTRSALSRYPIVSCSEFQFEKWSNDKRYLARYEIELPKFKNRIGSDKLKMSVYNTQLDFNWENIVQYEVQEMLAAIAVDPNPFIVICIDSNDASEEKQVWQTIEAAGFTRCINVSSKTVKYDSICLDNIFVNDNMKSLFYDVIDSNSYTFSAAQWNNAPISDHSLCYADIELLYDNIWCVKEDLTHVTSDIQSHHVKRGEPFTAHYTVDDGYEIYSVTVWMIDENFKIQDTVWDASTGTISIPEVTNDIYVKIVAQQIADTGDYGVSIPSGYTGILETGVAFQNCVVEMTVDIPAWDGKTAFGLMSVSYQGCVANSDNTWTGGIGSASYDASLTPEELVGTGKQTIMFSNLSFANNAKINILYDRSAPPAMTLYEVKITKNEVVVLHLMATDVPGTMKDVLTDKNYQFSVPLDGEEEDDESIACTGITLSADTMELAPSETQTLTATVTPDGCTDAVVWESDNANAATVSGGVVTAIASGHANITAKCGEYSASCAVTVSDDSGDAATYALHVPAGYIGELDTALRKSNNLVEITVDIPAWGDLTRFSPISVAYDGICAQKASDDWIYSITKGTPNAVNMTPSELVGAGKKTLEVDVLNTMNDTVRILYSREAAPEMTIYDYKQNSSDGTLKIHLVPTETPGTMRDVLTGTEYTFTVTEGMTVTPV